MSKLVAVQDILKHRDNLVLIDVRSPKEFQDLTIPGSINIPLFNDEERAEVGTIYKQTSPEAAKKRGLEIMSSKLPDLYSRFEKIKGDKVIYCWRGGMRSQAVETILDLMGANCYRLEGGIRSYRKRVLEQLEHLKIKPNAFVLNGGTGTGKTYILKQLHLDGYGVIDLEGLANHRGSVFGHIGRYPHNQKTFDSWLVHEILRIQNYPQVLFEAESKRIGKVLLPNFVMDKKAGGTQFLIELPIEDRVNRIMDDYKPWNHHKEYIQAFQVIKKRIHTPIMKQIETSLINQDYRTAIRMLLEYYYDPRYKHTIEKYSKDQFIRIQAENVDEATEKIKAYLNSTISGPKPSNIYTQK